MNAFRSINIQDDLDRSEVVASYRPTRKSLQVVRAICGGERSSATHIVAPYGSGKSIAALAGITLIAGDSAVAKDLKDRILTIDPNFENYGNPDEAKAQVILLHGANSDLAASIAEKAGLSGDTLQKVLSEVALTAKKNGVSRIAIVWDEFGQHLETLVRAGRPEDLLAVQDLAEWAVRRSNPKVTFTTIMHQGVHHYARRVSETAQAAWKKIEGRFDTLSLFEDGADALEMLSEVIKSEGPTPDTQSINRARSAGFFADIADDNRLARILANTQPLTPAAVQVLPSLSSKVAQAERTMFRFLEDVVAVEKSGNPLGLDAVYDFFVPAMRSDTGPGGTHRRLVEAETALSRVETELERRVLKATTLLQIGRSSERVKLPFRRLVFAVAEGTSTAPEKVEKCIDGLVDRKLLLHRRRADDISVWHGADLDLSRLIAEEAARLSLESDPIEALQRLFPADAYSASEYNYKHGVTRFARARYVAVSQLTNPSSLEDLCSEADLEDALVALVVDATIDQQDIVQLASSVPDHLILAFPKRSADVTSILTELQGIEVLLERADVLEQDPLIKRELLELKSEAEGGLRQALERLLNPDRGDVTWQSGRKTHGFEDGITAGDVLSEIFDTRFPDTPVIVNEQIVRRRVSAVTKSARKRCILAILERSGLPYLGYERATSADASIFRTVIERPGLYLSKGQRSRWLQPDEVEDVRVASVWRELKRFFTEPSRDIKSFDQIVDRLSAPPIGLREGVIPLWLTAGLVAFGRALSLRENVEGRLRYVDDVQPTVLERICDEPSRYRLEVADLTKAQARNLEQMIRALSGELDRQEPDLIRGFYDALLQWRSGLPPSALNTQGLGEAASILQPLLRSRIFDPLNMLLVDFPERMACAPLSKSSVVFFEKAVAEIEAVSAAFAKRAVEVSTAVFSERVRSYDRNHELLDVVETWVSCVPLDDAAIQSLDYEARGVLARARGAKNNAKGPYGLAAQLSGILCGENFDAWNDETVNFFRSRLQQVLVKIEDAVLERADNSASFEPFLRNRLASTFDVYRDRIGRDRLIQLLNEIYEDNS